MFLSLWLLAAIFLLLQNALQQVLCVANFQGELVLEAFNKRAKQLCICLLERKNALKRGVAVESVAQRQIHQDGDDDLEAEVQLKELVGEDGTQHLQR